MYCNILPPFYRSTNIHTYITHTTPLKEETEALMLKRLSVHLPTSINMVVSVITACSLIASLKECKRERTTQRREMRELNRMKHLKLRNVFTTCSILSIHKCCSYLPKNAFVFWVTLYRRHGVLKLDSKKLILGKFLWDQALDRFAIPSEKRMLNILFCENTHTMLIFYDLHDKC